ncbi:MAG: EamA family transporter [Proteobacteria bacterium]|jgi:drug/metabolite transporter (DMT)-like permease|nr:EamA family transporter [Pseudomonadota bacterium]MDA0883674.1 EamA family transporter [Pseudomonadota bacterium]
MIWFLSLFTREYEQRHALLIIFLASSFWGVLWVPMRHIEAMGLSGLWVVVLFHFLPALAILPLIVKTASSSRRDWGRAAVAGALMGAGFALYALGLVVASVTKTVILFYMTPIWSTVIAYFVLRERAGWRRWLAIAAALVGCALVTGVSRDELRFDPADLLGLLSGLFWALGSVVIRRYDALNFVTVSFLQYLFGGIMALLAALYFGDPIPQLNALLQAIPPAFLASVVLFLPSVLLIFRIMQYVSPGLVGILMLSEALVAAVSAAFWLGETLSSMQWIGVGAILTTGVFIGFYEGKAVKPVKPAKPA